MNTEEIAIRPVQDEDFPAITEIYNYYVLKGEQSFETEAVTAELLCAQMEGKSGLQQYLGDYDIFIERCKA